MINWLYFTSFASLMPYVDDVFGKSRVRIKATIWAVVIFMFLVSGVQLLSFISPNILSKLILLVVFFLLFLNRGNLFYRYLFSAILSIITSLNYIPLGLALSLKIGWTMLAIIVCSILSFVILPYSLEKESKIIWHSIKRQMIHLLI